MYVIHDVVITAYKIVITDNTPVVMIPSTFYHPAKYEYVLLILVATCSSLPGTVAFVAGEP